MGVTVYEKVVQLTISGARGAPGAPGPIGPAGSPFNGILTPEQFGGNTGPTDQTAAFQAMADYAAAQTAATGDVFTCLLLGQYRIVGPVYIRSAQRWLGASPHGPLDGGFGVALISLSATADMLYVATGGAVTIEGIGFDHNVTRTAGADIHLDGNQDFGGSDEYNSGSVITRCVSQGCWDFVRVRAANNWTARDNQVFNFLNCGFNLSGEGASQSTGDDSTGQSHIVNNVIHDVSGGASAGSAVGACVSYSCGGDVRVDGNKLLCGKFGVLLNLDRGPRSGAISTGTLTISNNSIEQQTIGCIRLEQAQAGNEFSNVTVVGNELSILGTIPTAEFMLSVVAGTPTVNPKWISLISVTGNACNGISNPNIARSMFDLQDGEYIYVGGNTFRGFGNGNAFGFSWGGNVSNLYIGTNPSDFTADKKYALFDDGVAAMINDAQPILTQYLPACADGSTFWVADGQINDSGGIAGGAATGLMAVRRGGSWVAIQAAEGQRQLNITGSDDQTIVGHIGTVSQFGSASATDLQYRIDGGGDHVFGMGGYEAGRFLRDNAGAGAGISPVVLGADPTLAEPSHACLYVRQSDGALRYWNPHVAAWQTVSAA